MTAIKFFLCLMLSAAPCKAALSIYVAPDNAGTGTIFHITQTSPSPVLNVGGLGGFALGIAIPTSMFNIADFGPGSSSAITGDFPIPVGQVTERFSALTFLLSGLRISADPSVSSFLGLDQIFTIPTGTQTLQFQLDPLGPVDTPISIQALNVGVHSVQDTLFGQVTVTVVPEPASFFLGMVGAAAFFFRRYR